MSDFFDAVLCYTTMSYQATSGRKKRCNVRYLHVRTEIMEEIHGSQFSRFYNAGVMRVGYKGSICMTPVYNHRGANMLVQAPEGPPRIGNLERFRLYFNEEFGRRPRVRISRLRISPDETAHYLSEKPRRVRAAKFIHDLRGWGDEAKT